MIPNESKLFKENKNHWKKMFSPKYKKSFLWSFLRIPTDENVLQKKFSSKKLSIIFFRNIKFNYSHHSFVPHSSFITNVPKLFLERIIFCAMSVLRKRNFLFYLPNSVLPLKTMSKKTYRNTYQKKFFQKMFFLPWFVCTPIEESYKTNQIFLKKTNFNGKKCFL